MRSASSQNLMSKHRQIENEVRNMELDGISKIHHMKYKRTQPWEKDLRSGGGEEKMPLPKL